MSKHAEIVAELRSMTAEDLAEYLQQQRRRLFEVRFQQAAGQVENHRQIREIRREIARTMTLQMELVRGHHLASDLEVAETEEEPEEQPQPRPRRLRLRRETAAPVAPAEVAATVTDEVEVEPEEAGDIEDAIPSEIDDEDATGADEDVKDE